MPRLLPVVLLVALVVYTLIDAAQSDGGRVRLMPRWLWMLSIVLLPGVGAVAWLLFGRPRHRSIPPGSTRRPVAPDDDPDFLRGL